MIPGPLVFRWREMHDDTGEVRKVMEPIGRFAREAASRYVLDETYTLDEIQERSSASHAHYFASVGEAWRNLPEELSGRWPTAEHLRKAALIRAGYRDERTIVCGSRAEAQRVAAFIAPMDEYALVSVSGATVVVLTAKSQSMRAMGKKAFEESKAAVLEALAEMVGVTTSELHSAAASQSAPFAAEASPRLTS